MSTGNPKGKIEASIETKLLYERLKETGPGDTIPYDELTELIGTDVRDARGRGYLRSARVMLQNLHEILTITIRGQGIRHATDIDVVDDIGREGKSIHRKAVKASRKPACIKNYDSLPSDAKIRHNVHLSLIGAIKQATSSRSRKLLTDAVTAGQGALPVAKTLELFAN